MSRPARTRFRHVILPALACALVAILPARAQEPSNPWLQKTHAFRRLLYERGFQPLESFEKLAESPAHSILIVFGDTRILDLKDDKVRDFVIKGGALFVATDHEVPKGSLPIINWNDRFGVAFKGQPVLGVAENSYQENVQCPFISPVQGARPNLFANLKLPVACNRAGYLTISPLTARDRELARLAVFEGESWHNELGRRNRPFAAGGRWGDGRMLFMADHSIFINNMMLQADLDNVGFTFNCMDWLSDGPTGRRDRVLFYEDNEIQKTFDVPVQMPPIRLPDDLTKLANDVLAGLENENKHNELLMQFIPEHQIPTFLTILLTSLLGFYLIRRLWQSRFRLYRGAPLLATTLARYAPTGATLSERHKALLADGNLWEPAREMARDFFETALGTHEPPKELPRFEASENWLTRRFLDKLLTHLWRLAYSNSPERIVPASFAHLAAQLDELKAALSDGSLRFQTPATS
jgi:hypothetical protein